MAFNQWFNAENRDSSVSSLLKTFAQTAQFAVPPATDSRNVNHHHRNIVLERSAAAGMLCGLQD
jgi:hypothetical protein